MIFKDAFASKDRDDMPCSRGVNTLCLNCGNPYFEHYGWSCSRSRPTTQSNFSKLSAHEHYITTSMLSSLGYLDDELYFYHKHRASVVLDPGRGLGPASPAVPRPVTPAHAEKPQWLVSRMSSTAPGECPCGVARNICSYHR